jgi:hypothetical protein
MIILKCLINIDFFKKIRFKNNLKLKPDKRFLTKSEDKNYLLLINNAKIEDGGKYKALFRNKAGEIQTLEATLNITGFIYKNNKIYKQI